MELKVESTMTPILLKIIVFSAFISVSVSQVMVDMKPVFESNPLAASAKLTCDFSVDDETYTFYNLEWRIDGSLVADFFGGASVPDYQNFCLSSGNCDITRNSSQSDFVISSLDIAQNNKPFSCQVTFSKGAGTINGQNSALLIVVVPTNTPEMLNGSSSESFKNGSTVGLSLDVASHIFQCKVAGINPKATFTWTVGDEQLPPDIITESHVVDSVTGLTTSTSSATLISKQDYNDKTLTCKAVNYEGDPGVMFYLVLKVEDPCVGVECKNGGTCFIDPNDPSMTQCNCTDGYKGDFCETADMSTTTTTTPQDTSTPTFPTQEATMSPTTQTTSDLSSTESSTTINTVTGSINESTTPTGPSERTTGSTEMTYGSTEMTNSTYPLIPSTTANTPETTTRCTSLCDEETPATLSFGVILGIIAGCVCLVLIIIACGIAIWKYNNKTEVSPESNQNKNGKKKEVDGKVDV